MIDLIPLEKLLDPAEQKLSQLESRILAAFDRYPPSQHSGLAEFIVFDLTPESFGDLSDFGRMSLLRALRPSEDGASLSQRQIDARSVLYLATELDPEFVAEEQNRYAGMVAQISNKVDLPAISHLWPEIDGDDRLDVVIALLIEQAQLSYTPPPRIIDNPVIPPGAQNVIQLAEYLWEGDRLSINSHPLGIWNDPVDVLALSAHEMGHKIQYGYTIALNSFIKLGQHDSAEWLPKLHHPHQQRASWYFSDNIFYGHITPEQNRVGYNAQPIERHARLIENTVRTAIINHLSPYQDLVQNLNFDFRKNKNATPGIRLDSWLDLKP